MGKEICRVGKEPGESEREQGLQMGTKEKEAQDEVASGRVLWSCGAL